MLFFILLLSLTAKAQNEKLRVQVGGVFDLHKIDDWQIVNVSKGLNLGVEFFLSDKLSISSAYSRFQKIEGRYNHADLQGEWINKFSATSLNGRYYFIRKRISPFVLSGLSYYFDRTEYIDVISISGQPSSGINNDDRLAIDLGLGLVIKITDRFSFYSQLKYSRTVAFYEISSGLAITNTGISVRLK